MQAKTNRLISNKANKITSGNKLPLKSEGSDGDITIRSVRSSGKYLCIKINGVWNYVPLTSSITTGNDVDRLIAKRYPLNTGEIGYNVSTDEFKFFTTFGCSSEQSVQTKPNNITSCFSGHLERTSLISTS